MVIGERFAWAHIPKTGGDLVLALFQSVVPDLVVEAESDMQHGKHHGFARRDPEVGRKPILAANIRRLPDHQLSTAHHHYRHGFGPTNFKPYPMWSPEEVVTSGRADRKLEEYMIDGELRIEVWMRMEHLREDFIDFVSRLRPLSEDELTAIREVNPRKGIPDYDHDPTHFFTREQIERLYENNPTWAGVEQQVYGDLAIPEEATGREPGADAPWWEPYVQPRSS